MKILTRNSLLSHAIMSLVLVTVFFLGNGCATRNAPRPSANAFALANQHGLQLSKVIRSLRVTLPTDFNGPNWGLKQTMSLKAGYDLRPFAGEPVIVTGYRLKENYAGRPAAFWVVEADGQILGAYISVDDLIPGIFALPRRDLWNDLERAGRPITSELQQTQFALIGEIAAPEGIFYVAVQRLVITGMLAPRGQTRLLLFDRKRQLVADYSLSTATPLWCEDSRIFLWGDGLAYDISVEPHLAAQNPESGDGGNVIDFSRGVHHPFITREKRYGSSGGIEDAQVQWKPMVPAEGVPILTAGKDVKVKLLTIGAGASDRKIKETSGRERLYKSPVSLLDYSMVALRNPDSGKIAVLSGLWDFYICDSEGIIACWLQLGGSFAYRRHFYETQNHQSEGLDAAISEFVATLEPEALTQMLETFERVFLSKAAPTPFFTAGSEGGSQPGQATIESVEVEGGLVRLETFSEGRKSAGTFWIDLKQGKIVRSVVDGQEMHVSHIDWDSK